MYKTGKQYMRSENIVENGYEKACEELGLVRILPVEKNQKTFLVVPSDELLRQMYNRGCDNPRFVDAAKKAEETRKAEASLRRSAPVRPGILNRISAGITEILNRKFTC
jgi:hypothetical protein